MRRLIGLVFASSLVVSGHVLPGEASEPVAGSSGARCANGSLSEAATRMFGAGTEVVGHEAVAGLEGALVLEPRIAPGTRARVLRVGDLWCEASSGFNLAWSASGRSFADGAAVAAAYARLAAAPYFDDVTVTRLNERALGTYSVVTHALTNGIEARWTIATDAAGVRSATWTAIAFARKPFVAEIEGLSALPGANETYARAAGGFLVARRGLPTTETVLPPAGGIAEYITPDKFRIVISLGDSRVAIDPGIDTGVFRADIVRETIRALKVNYEEFYAWGMRKGWGELEPVSGPNTGYVYINNALSLYCWACVFIADDFQIHMVSEIEAVLATLGFTYPDTRKAFQNVIGHEMFHNFQNRYNKPGPLGRQAGRQTPTAYSEGTARAQEAMHGYSDVSYQPGSLIYSTGRENPLLSLSGNSCNGFDGSSMNSAMASGIFNKTYNACYFWLSWTAAEGHEGLVKLVSEGYPAYSHLTDAGVEGISALDAASARTPAAQLAHFAGGALTGRGYVLAAPTGGPALDWGAMLERWDPAGLAVGGTASASLGNSGMLARKLSEAATVSISDASKANLFVVVDDGSATRTSVVEGDSVCLRPKAGETVWVGAVRTQSGAQSVTLAAGAPTCTDS